MEHIYDESENPRQHSLEIYEEEADNSYTTTFQYLNDLYNDGKISGEKVFRLKSKYQELVNKLKITRDEENRYLEQGKELMQIVQKQNEDLEKGENFLSDENNEVNKLRVICLKHANTLTACNERIYQLDFKLGSLKEEKGLLEQELNRLPHQDEVENVFKNYTSEIKELKLEIAQRAFECDTLTEEYISQSNNVKEIVEEIQQSEKEKLLLKEDLVKIHTEPNHLAKQCELIARKQRDTKEKYDCLSGSIKEVNQEIDRLAGKKIEIVTEKERLSRVFEEHCKSHREKEKEAGLLTKECELAKDHQAELLGDRATLDLKLKHIYQEKILEQNIHARKVREKDRALKTFKKEDMQLKVLKDGLTQTQAQFNKTQLILDSQPKDDGSLLMKRRELRNEVDMVKQAYSEQNNLTVLEKQRVEQGCHEEARLMMEQGLLRSDVMDLTRLAQLKSVEREQKSRDCLKAEMRYHKSIEDLRGRELLIQDSTKKFVEVQKRLEDFGKLYDIIKNERNKCLNLIQTSTQKSAELREKIKVLQNEIEILRSATVAKDRQSQKSSLKLTNSVVVRDSLRNEVSKQQLYAEDMKSRREQQRLSISKLNDTVNKSEDELVEYRRRYESAVQNRNRRGIQLIDRNDEVCVLYEKANLQDSILRNGSIELQSKKDEIRFLNMEANDLKREIDLLRTSVPKKKALDEELSTLQIQLLLCQQRTHDLERQMEDPTKEDRVRMLPGSDLHADGLVKKVDQLEKRLSTKEDRLLEKDLIYEQVSKLVHKTKNKCNTRKDETLCLSKKVNEVQDKIKDATRKMMAMVSELSMNQALSMKYKRECKEKNDLLQQCYVRMEQGLAPCEQLEEEWLRHMRGELRKIKEKATKEKSEEELENYRISGGIITTAEPRPNAYIPDDDSDLPLPRPYGRNAPFKPTELGSNMRHIRKPVLKPVEL